MKKEQSATIKVSPAFTERLLNLEKDRNAVKQAQDQANDYAARMYRTLNEEVTKVWKELLESISIKHNPNFDDPEWTLTYATSTIRRLTEEEKEKLKENKK